MKNFTLAVFAVVCFQTAETQTFTSSNLPIVLIETNGQFIPDDPKITATMKIIHRGGGLTNHVSDPPNVYDGFIGIELRGATSQQFYPKKPYDIELRNAAGDDLEAPLLGMPEESDWALISPLNDKTLMRDALAYKFAGQAMEWAPHTHHCEVVINGQYEGIYNFTETIERDKNRVDIAKLKATDIAGDNLTGGYILKFDKVNGGGFGGDFLSAYPPIENSWQQTWFHLHYPKYANAAPEQRDYIKNYIYDFENALAAWTPNAPGTPVYQQWIDVDSWVNYLLVNELAKNIDAYRLSAYFYKNRNDVDGSLKMGPVWDFNISFGIGDYCQGESSAGWVKDFNKYCGGDQWVIHFWWEKICRDSVFQRLTAERWRNLRETAWTNEKLLGCVDSMAATLADAQQRNFQRWPVLGQYVWPNAFIGQTFDSEVNYLKNWLLKRLDWMDKNVETVGPSALPPYPYIERMRIFPNPILPGTELTLEYNTAFLKDQPYLVIYDMLGRAVVGPEKLPLGKRVRHKIALPSLPDGTYFYALKLSGRVLKQGLFQVVR